MSLKSDQLEILFSVIILLDIILAQNDPKRVTAKNGPSTKRYQMAFCWLSVDK